MSALLPWFAPPPPTPLPRAKVAVLGAGIAGAQVAHSLAQHGLEVHVYERHPQVANGGSGNSAGLLRPLIKHPQSPNYRFYQHCFTYLEQSQQLPPKSQRSGVFCATPKPLDGLESPYWDADRASEALGISLRSGGYWLAQATYVSPRDWATQLLSHPGIRVYFGRSGPSPETCSHHYDACVLCHAPQRGDPWYALTQLPLHLSMAQTHRLPARAPLRAPLCGSDYVIPVGNEWLVGAHHQLGCKRAQYLEPSRPEALKLDQLWTLERPWPRPFASRSAVRVNSSDNFPVVGALPDWAHYHSAYADLHHGKPTRHYPHARYQTGVFLLTALGGHGLCSSALAAAHIRAQMLDQPSPLPTAMQTWLHPGRFLIRALKRQSRSFLRD